MYYDYRPHVIPDDMWPVFSTKPTGLV